MERRECDVVIIGGGVAGLAATGELGRRGLRVALLEARGRLGGRVHTVRRTGWPVPIELGAQFIHGGNDAFWRVVKQQGLAKRQVPARHWRFAEGTIHKFDATKAIADVTQGIDEKRMYGWSFAEYMRRAGDEFTELERNVATGFVEGFEAAPADEMSAVAVAGETLEDDQQYFLPQGYDNIVAGLTQRLVPEQTSLYVEAPCRTIQWRRGAVEVRTAGLVVSGVAAIVTVPLGVWQSGPHTNGAMEFAPALPSHAAAARQMGMGHVIRITFRFDARRWRSLLPETLRGAAPRGLGFVHARPEKVPVWWSLTNAAVTTGWAGGPAALALSGKPERQIQDAALASLARVCGIAPSELRAAVKDVATHNWSRDPFSRGAYSFTRAGAEDAAKRFREPVKDTLFFAGEATADGEEVGTVHGALSSGLRAAKEVIAVL